MKRKQAFRLTIDALMLIILFVVMGYSLTGNTVHEWMGIALTALVVVHLILNKSWFTNLLKGKYRWRRAVGLIINGLLILTFLAIILSSMPISAEVFPFVHLFEEEMWPATIHIVLAYWFFLLCAVHLGMQWPRVMPHLPKALRESRTVAPAVLGLISLYGLCALWSRGVFAKLVMTDIMELVREPDVWTKFLLDYGSIFVLLSCVGYYGLVKRPRKK